MLAPWDGKNAQAIKTIFENKLLEAVVSAKEEEDKGWFNWFCVSFEDVLNDAFIHEDHKIEVFEPTEDDR